MSDVIPAYFHGYVADRQHPWMASTGSDGRCELCGQGWDHTIHEQPWVLGEPPDQQGQDHTPGPIKKA